MHIILTIKILINFLEFVKSLPDVEKEAKKDLSKPWHDLIQSIKAKNFEDFKNDVVLVEKGVLELLEFCEHEDLKPIYNFLEGILTLIHKHKHKDLYESK